MPLISGQAYIMLRKGENHEKEWMRDPEEESVDREAKLDVKERVELPEVGETVEVTLHVSEIHLLIRLSEI